MEKRGEITRDTAVYGTGFFGASIISRVVRGIFVARFLGPSTYGLLSAYRVILLYSRHSNLGTINAMQRDVPFYHGKGDEEKARQITNTVFSSCLLFSLIVALGILIFSFFPNGKEYAIGLRIVALIVIAQQMYGFYTGFLRANKEFTLMSKSVVLYAAVDVFLAISLTLLFGIYGTLLSILIVNALLVIYIHTKVDYSFSIRFKVGEVIEQIKLGFPIMLTVIIGTFLESIDRLFILAMLSYEDLGYYSIGIVLLGFLLQIPRIVSVILLPNISEKFGGDRNVKSLKKYLEIPTLGVTYITALLTGGALLIMHFLFYYLLPEYIPGLGAAKILTLCAFFSAFSITSGVVLITIHEQNKLIVMQVFTVALAFLFNYAFIKAGMGIWGVAMATLISYALLGTAKTLYALTYFGVRKREAINFFGRILLPFLYLLALVFVLDLYIPNNYNILFEDLLSTALKLLLYFIFSSPVIFILEKKTSVLNILTGLIKARFVRGRE